MGKADWIRIIHVAKTKTGIDDTAYRGILSGVGCDSSKDIRDVEQFKEIMLAFSRLGFRYDPRTSAASGNKRKPSVGGAPGFITKRQEYYIRGLWQLASRAKDEKSLTAMIMRIGKVDAIEFLPRKSASSVILALRKICWDAGLNPDHAQRG
jgi:hypothetical protein